MHIFFSGIGGAGIGPLALIARQAGYDVSGSDKQDSTYIDELRKAGITCYIGQTQAAIAAHHAAQPIDWFVYSSAVIREKAHHPELEFAKHHKIRTSKRDALLNHIITDKQLKLIGVAGTHGKSTTTAMIIWLFHALGLPTGYSVGAKIPFGPMGQLSMKSDFFVYECDEFDYNFLAFHPYLSVITGIGWDHHEIFPTEASFKKAFRDFISQSIHTLLWQKEADLLGISEDTKHTVLVPDTPSLAHRIRLAGIRNRENAWLAVMTVQRLTGAPLATLIEHIHNFPGLKQRMELLAPQLYTNYAHTPEKLKAGMDTVFDLAKEKKQAVIVIYEPLTNRRQHYIKDTYKDTFEGATKLYWIPTYLAREDPDLAVLTPADLIPSLDNAAIAEPAALNDTLLAAIKKHRKQGDIVVAMGASGAGSLDEWLRKKVKEGQL